MLRYVKVFLALSVGAWGLIGTVGNLADLDSVYAAVLEVTTMSGVPENTGPPWRTDNPVVVWIGVIAIVLGKVAAFVGGGLGGMAMLKHARSMPDEFRRSKRWAVAGIALAFGLLFVSFTVSAESAFFMFYHPQFQEAGELAFRLSGSLALIAIFIAQPELE